MQLRHGSRLDSEDGLPVRLTARCGTDTLRAVWEGPHLLQARLHLPDHREVVIRPGAAIHPVLGPCHAVTLGDDAPLALFAAVDLAAPDHIPAMDRPGALPSGAGSAILAFVARQARGPLRYRGPYATGALFDALLSCFTVDDPVAAHQRFVADAEARAWSADAGEVPVAFHPAPFERWWPRPDVCVQLRDGVERAWIAGRAWARDAAGARRIRPHPDGWEVRLELGGRTWSTVAVLDPDGTVREGPHPPRAPRTELIGHPLPPWVRDALRRAIPPTAPRSLRAPLEAVLAEVPLLWGDPGLAVSAVREGGIVVHAGLLEALPTLAPEATLRHLADAIAEPARALAVRGLASGR